MAEKVVLVHDGKNILRRCAVVQQNTKLVDFAKCFWWRWSRTPRLRAGIHWEFTTDTSLEHPNQQDHANSSSITLPQVSVGEQDFLCVWAVHQCSRGLPHVPESTESYSVDIYIPHPQLHYPDSLRFWSVLLGLNDLYRNICLRTEYPLSRTAIRNASYAGFAFSNNGFIFELSGKRAHRVAVSIKSWKMENWSRSSTICR